MSYAIITWTVSNIITKIYIVISVCPDVLARSTTITICDRYTINICTVNILTMLWKASGP